MTMRESSNGGSYYYAGGRRVDLEVADDLVAVDRPRLTVEFPLLVIPNPGLKMGAGLELLQRSQFNVETINEFISLGLTRPAYRQAGSILVLLPEIRIECPNDKTLDDVAASLANNPGIKLTQSPGRLVLALDADQANETLRLANHLYETHPGLSVTPRFLRVVESPKVAR